MTPAPAWLGLDLGGTRVKALALDGGGRVLAELTRDIADAGEGWRETVRVACRELRERVPQIAAAGVCAPGLPTRDEQAIGCMPGRLPGLEGLVWSDFLQLPAVVLNDAHAALLGEVWQGAARDRRNVLMLTLGTGVGGAALVDGQLLRGHLGRAGHVGHISLNPDGAAGITGTPGSLEDAIGECTLPARSGGRFSTTRDLVEAVARGDREAQQVWERSLRALAAGLASLINVLDPEIIVIGGGIAAAGDTLFQPLSAAVARMEWRIGDFRVTLRPAQLGAQAGAFGAAYRASQFLHP